MPIKTLQAGTLSEEQKEAVCRLWNREYPRQLAVTSSGLEEYLLQSTGQNHFLIQDETGNIIGWAYSFNRDGDRWFSIIIDQFYQGRGLGQMLLNLMKANETRLNGWVIDHPNDVRQDGEFYQSPLGFYINNGFTVRPETRYDNDKISSVKIEWRK